MATGRPWSSKSRHDATALPARRGSRTTTAVSPDQPSARGVISTPMPTGMIDEALIEALALLPRWRARHRQAGAVGQLDVVVSGAAWRFGAANGFAQPFIGQGHVDHPRGADRAEDPGPASAADEVPASTNPRRPSRAFRATAPPAGGSPS